MSAVGGAYTRHRGHFTGLFGGGRRAWAICRGIWVTPTPAAWVVRRFSTYMLRCYSRRRPARCCWSAIPRCGCSGCSSGLASQPCGTGSPYRRRCSADGFEFWREPLKTIIQNTGGWVGTGRRDRVGQGAAGQQAGRCLHFPTTISVLRSSGNDSADGLCAVKHPTLPMTSYRHNSELQR